MPRRNDPKLDDHEFAIAEGYWSDLYPFLETLTPTDTLHFEDRQHLPPLEQAVLEAKKPWLASPCPAELAALVSHVIENRKDNPITNAVCLGVGGRDLYHERNQFVIFSQVVAQLAIEDPEILSNVYVQDPNLTDEMRAAFENIGGQVVETPTAFELIGADTFLFSAFVYRIVFMYGLNARPVEEIPSFIGNGVDMSKFWNKGGRSKSATLPRLSPRSRVDRIS